MSVGAGGSCYDEPERVSNEQAWSLGQPVVGQVMQGAQATGQGGELHAELEQAQMIG